jgi:hypothetical protein
MLLLVDHLLALEHGMYNRWFELLEDAMWTAPTAPATTTAQKLFGIPFWVQKNSSLGFNGGNPSGFSAGAGSVDASTYSGWKNYTGTYGAVSRDDLISKWLKAVDHCNFRPPHAYPTTSKLEDPQYVYYTTHPVMEASRKYLDSRQDNITDMSGVANPMFRSVPLQWVPALSNSDAAGYDSTNPIYGINWGAMDLCFNAGKEMQRIGPNPVAGQVNVRAVFTQAVLQLICHDRRSQFVLYQA